MEWGLSTHLFVYQQLDEKLLELIHSLGFNTIELWAMRPHFDYEQPVRVRQLAQAAASQGITIRSVHAPFYTHVDELLQGHTLSLTASNPQVRQEALAHTEKVMEVMDMLGAELLVVHASGAEDDYSAGKLSNLRHSLEQLLLRLQEKGIKLALENIVTPLSTTDHLLELIEPFSPDQVGICLDIGHAHLNETVEAAILNCGSRIMGVHISDNDGTADSHFIPGEGVIDWQNVINMLSRACYNGILTLELRQYQGLQTTLDKIKSGKKCNFSLNFYADQENKP
jgi:sugar phosphate isomerase/epimerase